MRIRKDVTAIAGVLLFLIAFGISRRVKAQPSPPAADAGAAIAVFQGDTLDDLARLLRPLSIQSNQGSSITGLYLADAIFAGSTNGVAQILSVWLTTDQPQSSLLLRHQDASRKIEDVADDLAQGSLKNTPFALLPLAVSWQNWNLTVLQNGTAAIRASANSTSAIQAVISAEQSPLRTTDTRSITVPIGYGQTKPTDWTPFFDPNQVVIKMIPTGVGAGQVAKPDVTALKGKAGMQIGDAFFNNVLKNEYKNRVWSMTLNTDSYRASDVSVSAQPNVLTLTATVMDLAPATATVQLTLGGSDLAPSKVSAFIKCNTMPLGQCVQLQGKIDGAALALTAKFTTSPQQPIRPTGVESLGNFTIGNKPLYELVQIDSLQAAGGATIVAGTFRFQGGRYQ